MIEYYTPYVKGQKKQEARPDRRRAFHRNLSPGSGLDAPRRFTLRRYYTIHGVRQQVAALRGLLCRFSEELLDGLDYVSEVERLEDVDGVQKVYLFFYLWGAETGYKDAARFWA